MKKIFKDQIWHFVSLLVLLSAIFLFVRSDEEYSVGSLWSIPTMTWLVLAILSPIIHQLYVLICWRIELYFKGLSKMFGKHAFTIYKLDFTLLILSRPITIILLAWSNQMTLNISSNIASALSIVFALPAIYALYSVARYFGFERAFGIDHFHPERLKELPFVKQGIFKYTSNGMYKYGFLALWIPGLLFQSKAALLIALFNHLYIWVHYYCVELPDIKVIYGDSNIANTQTDN